MRAQFLRCEVEADSGYCNPVDFSESIPGHSFESLEHLNAIVRSSRCPYTILYGGHQVDELAYHDDSHSHNRTILVVPKDTVVKILLPDRAWTSSIGNYDRMIKDLHIKLQDHFDNAAEEIVLIDSMGTIFDLKSSLSSVQHFDHTNSLVCRKQVHEYLLVSSHSGRMSSALSQARSLQEDWCRLGSVQEDVENAQLILTNTLKESYKLSSLRCGNDVALKAFNYDRFKQDFPPGLALPRLNSLELIKLKDEVTRSVGKHSACPVLAQNIVQTLISNLNRTNKDLASKSALFLGRLIEPLVDLADKEPMKHDHSGYYEKLVKAKRSMENYKSIMALNLFGNPDEQEQRENSLHALLEVSQFTDFFRVTTKSIYAADMDPLLKTGNELRP